MRILNNIFGRVLTRALFYLSFCFLITTNIAFAAVPNADNSYNLRTVGAKIYNELVNPISAPSANLKYSYLGLRVYAGQDKSKNDSLTNDSRESRAGNIFSGIVDSYYSIGENFTDFSNKVLDTVVSLEAKSGEKLFNSSVAVLDSTVVAEGEVGSNVFELSQKLSKLGNDVKNLTNALADEEAKVGASVNEKKLVQTEAVVLSENKIEKKVASDASNKSEVEDVKISKIEENKASQNNSNQLALSIIDELKKIVASPKAQTSSADNSSFVSKSDFLAAIKVLNESLNLRLSNLAVPVASSQTYNNVSQNLVPLYQMISLSQKIDSLLNTTITNPTISGGSISGTAISATSFSVSSLSVSGAVSFATTTLSDLTISTSTAGCAQFSSTGQLFSSGSSCGGVGGSGDITSVGDVASGAAFDGTQGTTLTFFNASGNATQDYNGTKFSFSKLISFPYSSSTIYSTFQTSSTTLASIGTLNLTGPSQGYAFLGSSGLVSTVSTSTLAGQLFPFTSATGYNSTSTTLGLLNGFFSTASSTISSSLFLSSLSQGFSFTGSNGLVSTISTSTLASQVFTATTFAANSILTTNSAGNIIATGSQLTVGNILATSTTASSYSLNNWTGFGTTTPRYLLQLASSTAPQLVLTDSTTTGFAWRNAGGTLYLSTTSATTFATTSTPILTVSGTSGLLSFPYSSSTAYSSFANASSTLLSVGTLNITGPSQGFTFLGSSGLVSTIGTSTLASQVFTAITFAANSILTTNSAGNIIATSSQLTFGSFLATSTTANSYSLNNWTGFGTTTSRYLLQLASSTASQLALSDGSSSSNQWTFRVAGTSLYLGTTSPTTFASSTSPAISFNSTSATTTIGFFTSTTTGLTAGSGVSLIPQNMIIVGDGKATSSMAIVKGGLCVDTDGWCTAASTTAGYISGVVLSAGGSDLAENYYSNEALEPGDIVSPSLPVNYMSKSSDKNTMLGIVSTEPGVALGGGPDYQGGGFPVALAGRVPVKVNNEGGNISVGDGITLSSVHGVGTKARPGEVVIAIALDNFNFENKQSGKVLGFVTKTVITPRISLAEMNSYLEEIAGLSSTTTEASSNFAKSFFQNIFSKVGTWLSDATNNVGNIFAKAFHAKEEICVDDQCLTKEDVRNLLALVHRENNNAPDPTPTPTPAPVSEDTIAPVITVNGNNPATITVGTSYVDLGASVTDTGNNGQTNNNLSIHYFVDGIEMSDIGIDTSTTSVKTIIYRATDTAGNVGESTRTVNIVLP